MNTAEQWDQFIKEGKYECAFELFNNTFRKAEKNMEQGMSVDAAFQDAGFVKSGWLQNIMNDAVSEAKRDNPYFPYPKPFADLQKEDEDIDSLLMMKEYQIEGSLLLYYKDLMRFRIGELLNKLGFSVKYLVQAVNGIIVIIKGNTNKPIFVQNKIIEWLNLLSEYPGVGNVMQILILQGVIAWFEDCDINEGDKRYNEAEILLDWICDRLLSAMVFYTGFFAKSGESKPLDDYLATTEVGKAVMSYREMNNKAFGSTTEGDFSVSDKEDTPQQLIKTETKSVDAFSDFLTCDKSIIPELMKYLQQTVVGKGGGGKLYAIMVCALMKLNLITYTNKAALYRSIKCVFEDIGSESGFLRFLSRNKRSQTNGKYYTNLLKNTEIEEFASGIKEIISNKRSSE